MNAMKPRERWLAALDMKPADRLPFWPKLDGAYPRAQVAPFRTMDPGSIHEWIGSDRHDWIGGCVREARTKTSYEVSATNGLRRETFKTPSGELFRVQKFDEASQSWHPVKMPVESLDDVKVLTEWYEDVRCELDEDALKEATERAARIGEDAVTSTGIGESPLMEWIEWLAGVENAHFMLLDHRPEVEALFEAMHRRLLARVEIMADNSPADVFYMVENTSTTLISPDQFRTYCARHLREYVAIARARGRRIAFHMCGTLKNILPDLAEIGANAFEAFTSPPVGDTRLADGRERCPEVCLVGGTNAALWIRPADEIIAEIERDRDSLPPPRGTVVASAGGMPPGASPETIRRVSDWVKAYPARM